MHRPGTSAQLSIVVPTLNEVDNVGALVESIDAALHGVPWEIVFVDDDSSDGTTVLLRQMAINDPRVRLLHRIGRRGLSSAVVEGILSTSAPYVAVMDADLQHDETILPQMLEAVKSGGFDVAVASRYIEGGAIGEWDRKRALASRVATRLSTFVLRIPLTDPMSGYFVMTRVAFESAVRGLSCHGYKILLDLVASMPTSPRCREIPYVFRTGHSGASKLDAMVAWEYIVLVLDKLVGSSGAGALHLFSLVGSVGIAVHVLTLWLCHRIADLAFVPSQLVATMVAMTGNFFANNLLTYRDQRIRGWRLPVGLLSFYAVCIIGVVANVGIGTVIFRREYTWWIAGGAGCIVGAVWNFAVTALLTWRDRR